MTGERPADERVLDWLHEGTPDRLPERVLTATFERTRAARQRRTLARWRTRRMTPFFLPAAIAGASGILVITLLAVTASPDPSQSVGGPSCVTPHPTSAAVPSLPPVPISGEIAFSRTVDGNTDIYLLDLDRTCLRRLTDDPAVDGASSWSPDGKVLLFDRTTQPDTESDIYALNVETGALTRLTDDPGVESSPRFSPDGTRIAYDHWPSESGVWVMDADGSDQHRVFDTKGSDQYANLNWPLDGGAIYLTHRGTEILRLDVETGEAVPLDLPPGTYESVEFSPDGTMFAFQNHRPGDGLVIMDADGSDLRHVVGDWSEAGERNWSPDGDWLVYRNPTDQWLHLTRADGTEDIPWIEGRGGVWRPNP